MRHGTIDSATYCDRSHSGEEGRAHPSRSLISLGSDPNSLALSLQAEGLLLGT